MLVVNGYPCSLHPELLSYSLRGLPRVARCSSIGSQDEAGGRGPRTPLWRSVASQLLAAAGGEAVIRRRKRVSLSIAANNEESALT